METKSFYPYDEIISGALVRDKRIATLSPNSYRGFHKIDKKEMGAGKVFPFYLADD